ncbi:hypothetical protein [Spirosoma panaciterrae]|uniref:hypothetical protein n=1 Tax=Spirosoma panaciterrae TaxID=496058 RepID=UPI0003731452|nr:hypothetical protein [Spirosoma panaciterrae]
MITHLLRITQLFVLSWASIITLYAQTESTIQQAIDKKQYEEAIQQLDAAMAKLNPKVPAQQKQYGTYLSMKASILVRQKNYEEAAMQASEAERMLTKYASELPAIKNRLLLTYAGHLTDDEEKPFSKKVETLFLSSLDEKNTNQLFDTYMAIGDEEAKAYSWQMAATFYSSASGLPGVSHARISLVAPKLVAAMKKIRELEDEEEAQEKAEDRRKKSIAKPQKKKP